MGFNGQGYYGDQNSASYQNISINFGKMCHKVCMKIQAMVSKALYPRVTGFAYI